MEWKTIQVRRRKKRNSFICLFVVLTDLFVVIDVNLKISNKYKIITKNYKPKVEFVFFFIIFLKLIQVLSFLSYKY